MIDESIVYYTVERAWQITVLSNIVNSRYRGVDWLAVDGIRCLLLAPPPLTIHNRKCITIQQQFTLYRWYTSSLITDHFSHEFQDSEKLPVRIFSFRNYIIHN